MTGIVATFAVPSEGYQAMCELRRATDEAGFTVSAASLVRRTADDVELLDAIGADEAVLGDVAATLAAGTVAIVALVEEAEEGAIEAALAHLDVTVHRVNLDEDEKAAKKQARHEARVKKFAGALAALKAKGKAAEKALDDFADSADERKTATDESWQKKVESFAQKMEGRLEHAHDTLVADLDTIAQALDEDEETGAAPTEEDAGDADA